MRKRDFLFMKAKAKKSVADQPWPTLGTKLAAVGRREASKLSQEERREYYRQAMVLAYGGALKETTGTGH